MSKVAINGFGRIGRAFFRIAYGSPELDIVAINDPFITPEIARYLLVHDTVYHRYGKPVEVADGGITVAGKFIPLLEEREPQKLPWGKMGIDLVIESTGVFLERNKASWHLEAGAKRVLLSAPPKSGDIRQFVYGVNHTDYDPAKDTILAAASCTTNSFAPVAYVLEKEFGIVHAWLSTVHGYTADQRLVDSPHKKFTRGRAAAANIVPTTTGAATATTKIIPSLVGKMNGMAFRVPVPTGSVSDVTAEMKRAVTRDEVNAVFRKYADGELNGVLGVSDDPMVSSDIIGDSRASVVDLNLTVVVDERLLKVVTFYDNEWGYTNQLVRVAKHVVS